MSNPSGPSSPSDLLTDLLLLSHAVRRVLQDEVVEEFQDRGLNGPRINLLRLLARRGAQSVNLLAAFLGITKAAACQNVDVLCENDFATRRDDEEDRRTTWVEITRAGRSVLETAERRQRERLRRVLAGLPRGTEEASGKVLRELALSLIGTSRTSEVTCLQCCAYRSAGCIRESGGWSCHFLERAAATRGAPVG